MSNSGVLGIVVLSRHGDRQELFQDPLTYDASSTVITPLGETEEFQLGSVLRSQYLDANSPTAISGMTDGVFDADKVSVRADTGDEGFVIFDSTVAAMQGLYPPSNSSTIPIANGSTILAPLGGYQYVPIESVEVNEDVSLEGWTDCAPFNAATAAFYNSSLFKQVAQEHAGFLQSLPPYLDGRAVTLQNMWNIFDYMNVQSIHNATFAKLLPDGYLEQARALANFHEYGVFTSPQLDGIGNIGGRAILPSVITGMENVANSSTQLKIVYQGISYKPFLSLFNMTGVAETYPQLAGVVEYAASVVFEVRQGSSVDDPLIRMRFKNGTNDNFTTYNMLGASGDVPLSLFKSKLQFATINTTAEWCIVCNNNADRGCGTCNNPALAAAAAAQEAGVGHHRLSPPVAGVVGAAVTAAVFVLALAALAACGFVSFGKKAKRSSYSAHSDASQGFGKLSPKSSN